MIPGQTFSVADMREDLRVLWAVLDEGHGGFERYTSREALKKSFDDAEGGLTGPLAEIQWYRRLLPLIAGIKDGHTSLRLSEAGRADLLARPVFFPFELRFIDGRAFLFRNLSDARDVPDGAELAAVNGAPVEEILRRLLPLVAADADIVSRRLRLLENPSMFGTLLAAEFGPAESYLLRIKGGAAGGPTERSVAGIKGAEIRSRLQERYPGAVQRKPLYELGFRGETAVLTIRGFGDDSGPGAVPYRAFLQNSFRELADKGTGALVIDLRGNGGGRDEYGRLLFAHFMDRPFLYYRALERKKESTELARYAAGSGDGVRSGALRPNARGWFDVLDHPNVGTMKPETPRFAGRTIILVDGLSFSTTGETTSLFHFHKKALFMGQECGAGYYGNTSGGMALVTLPKTRLQVVVPLTLYTLAVDGYPKNRGIVPDIPVAPTIADLLAGRDPVLERAIEESQRK